MGLTHEKVTFDIMNPQLFKNIAYVGSKGFISVQITFVFCSLVFSAHNTCGIGITLKWKISGARQGEKAANSSTASRANWPEDPHLP